MSASSSSGEKEPTLPEMRFPILQGSPAREGPDPSASALHIIEISEAFLPFAAGRTDFEASRLKLKARIPFRIFEPDGGIEDLRNRSGASRRT